MYNSLDEAYELEMRSIVNRIRKKLNRFNGESTYEGRLTRITVIDELRNMMDVFRLKLTDRSKSNEYMIWWLSVKKHYKLPKKSPVNIDKFKHITLEKSLENYDDCECRRNLVLKFESVISDHLNDLYRAFLHESKELMHNYYPDYCDNGIVDWWCIMQLYISCAVYMGINVDEFKQITFQDLYNDNITGYQKDIENIFDEECEWGY